MISSFSRVRPRFNGIPCKQNATGTAQSRRAKKSNVRFVLLFFFSSIRYTLENKKLDEKDTTFFERMRLQIMQNIEITLENMHISYETKSTAKLGHPFSFGFTLRHLKLAVRI